MLSRIDHVGIAVRDLDEAIRTYERRLGLRSTRRERLEREGIEIAMIPIGESRIELITPLNAKIAPPPSVRRNVKTTVRFRVQPPSLSWIRRAASAWP